MGYIYVFEFPNGKRYVGQTKMKHPKERWWAGYEGKVGKAIKEFGIKSVKKQVFEVKDDSMLDYLERLYIGIFRTTDPEYGYNSDSGGISGFNRKVPYGSKSPHYGHQHSEDTRRKCSEANKGEKNPNYGKHRSEETIRKIRESIKLTWARKRAQKIETEVAETPQV